MKPKVLVLGTFHMRQAAGMLSVDGETLIPAKEKEIKELIEKLKNFHPTKVAVEVEVKHQSQLDQEFQRYVHGDFRLPINEVHQIGFPLAKEMKHDQVHAIDWMDPLPEQKGLGEVLDWAEQHQPELHTLITKKIADNNENTDRLSFLDIYRMINSPDHVKRDHEVYMHIARIGEKENYVGMAWLRWWYQRNLILYSNLTRLAKDENDQIFFMIGSGHLHLVNQFLEESNLFDVEYPDAYL